MPSPPPSVVFAFGLLQAPISSNLSGFWPIEWLFFFLICKLVDAILLPVKEGTCTDAIFTSGMQSPLGNERCSIAEPPTPLADEPWTELENKQS